MSRSRGGMDGRCTNCKVHTRLCFCEYVKAIETKTKISIIMHVSERKLTSNTAWFTKRALKNCDLHLRGEFNNVFDGESILDDNYIPLFLFPEDDAKELNDEFLSIIDRPIQLIIPDGNWNQAKKVKAREKAFKNIQSVKLKKVDESIYSLRRSPFKGAVCTLEAISYALKEIEGESVHNHLMNILKVMVERTESARRGL